VCYFSIPESSSETESITEELTTIPKVETTNKPSTTKLETTTTATTTTTTKTTTTTQRQPVPGTTSAQGLAASTTSSGYDEDKSGMLAVKIVIPLIVISGIIAAILFFLCRRGYITSNLFRSSLDRLRRSPNKETIPSDETPRPAPSSLKPGIVNPNYDVIEQQPGTSHSQADGEVGVVSSGKTEGTEIHGIRNPESIGDEKVTYVPMDKIQFS